MKKKIKSSNLVVGLIVSTLLLKIWFKMIRTKNKKKINKKHLGLIGLLIIIRIMYIRGNRVMKKMRGQVMMKVNQIICITK
jgi:hypothetical protein